MRTREVIMRFVGICKAIIAGTWHTGDRCVRMPRSLVRGRFGDTKPHLFFPWQCWTLGQPCRLRAGTGSDGNRCAAAPSWCFQRQILIQKYRGTVWWWKESLAFCSQLKIRRNAGLPMAMRGTRAAGEAFSASSAMCMTVLNGVLGLPHLQERSMSAFSLN